MGEHKANARPQPAERFKPGLLQVGGGLYMLDALGGVRHATVVGGRRVRDPVVAEEVRNLARESGRSSTGAAGPAGAPPSPPEYLSPVLGESQGIGDAMCPHGTPAGTECLTCVAEDDEE